MVMFEPKFMKINVFPCKNPIPPMTISNMITMLITGFTAYDVNDTNGCPFVPRRSNPALQKADTE